MSVLIDLNDPSSIPVWNNLTSEFHNTTMWGEYKSFEEFLKIRYDLEVLVCARSSYTHLVFKDEEHKFWFLLRN